MERGTHNSTLHIGFLTSDLSHRNGWAHYSLSLVQALQRAGVRVTIIAARNSPEVDGLSFVRWLPSVAPPERFSLLRLALNVTRVRALLRECHLIHVTAEPYAPLGVWVAGRRPLFITGHGSYVHLPNLRPFPVNWFYRQAFLRAQVVCVSRYTARMAAHITPGIRTVVVNNGVDVERFAHIRSACTPKQGKIILTVGGVKARKGTLELVRAVAQVRRHFPDVRCIVIGSADAEPEYAARVRATITELGLTDCVHLLGFVPEDALMRWYAQADVFVLPSINVGWKFEGYGLAHIEASAAGLPVIGTTDCGAEDAVDDGVTGLLIPQTSVEAALPQAMIDLLTDRARAVQMGAAGRAKAQRQTWDAVAAQMVALYEAATHPRSDF